MTKYKVGHILRELLTLTGGAAVYAAGLELFLDPNKLAPGGVSGISVIISHVSGEAISTGLLILLFNIPLLLLAFFKLGKKLCAYSLYTLAMTSLFMEILNKISGGVPPIADDLLINTVAGGCLLAVGVGVVFRGGGTTGGSDIVVKLLRLKYRHIRTGTIFFLTDAVIVAVSGIVFRDLRIALYAALAVLIQAVVLDLVLYGNDGAGLVFIISEKKDEISARLLSELDCGFTILKGIGGYEHSEKKVLMAAMHKQTVPKARQIVREIDEHAFMIITTANQVFGEGFRDHTSEDL